jgi:hypothetical protein
MIWSLLGETGDGKTIFLAYQGYNAYLTGTTIHANFHLNYPYQPIRNIEDLKELPLEGNRLFLLDELWMTGDAFESNNKVVRLLSQFILQARKKNADVIHANQHESQLVSRIRVNTSLFLKPRITLCFDEINQCFTSQPPHPDTHIVPYMINIRFYDKFLQYLHYGEPYIVYPAHIYYDTFERIEPTPTLNYDRLIEKHKNFVGSRTELASVLEKIDHLSHREAMSFSNFINAMKENDYLKHFMKT